MALVAPTRVLQSKPDDTFHDLITVPGDVAYPAGGSPGFLTLFRALTGRSGVQIMCVVDQSQPSTVAVLQYDHTNDKLFARVRATGAESAVADQSGSEYRLYVISK